MFGLFALLSIIGYVVRRVWDMRIVTAAVRASKWVKICCSSSRAAYATHIDATRDLLQMCRFVCIEVVVVVKLFHPIVLVVDTLESRTTLSRQNAWKLHVQQFCLDSTLTPRIGPFVVDTGRAFKTRINLNAKPPFRC